MNTTAQRFARRFVLFSITFSMLFLAGCLEGSAQRTGIFLPPKPISAPIDVYIDSEPAWAWGEVGIVNAEGSGWSADFNDLVLVMQDQARNLGADAVIVTDTWTEEDVWYDEYGYEHFRTRMYSTGIAIYYR